MLCVVGPVVPGEADGLRADRGHGADLGGGEGAPGRHLLLPQHNPLQAEDGPLRLWSIHPWVLHLIPSPSPPPGSHLLILPLCFAVNVTQAIIRNIDKKAEAYSDDLSRIVFQMNNLRYILKSLET